MIRGWPGGNKKLTRGGAGKMNIVEKTREFVTPLYNKKDIGHNFAHIERVIRQASRIAANYSVDDELLMLGAYFHGVIHIDEGKVRDFLRREKVAEDRISRIVQVAWESQGDRTPVLLEGKILHDAHFLEGGKTFFIVKTIMIGASKGESLQQITEHIKIPAEVPQSALPELQAEYDEKDRFTRDFINSLSKNL
jgi:uncharacterized protein